MSDGEYERKVASQIEQFADGFGPHALPPAYGHWAARSFYPGFEHVFGTIDVQDLYAVPFAASASSQHRPRFLSIGCGDCTYEIGLGQRLAARGLVDFEFVCADISPPLIERAQAALPAELKRCFTLHAIDLNRMDDSISGPFDGVMASHSLHHLVELERVFAWVKRSLRPGCVFAINDMIGRNGHQRWPETAIFVQMLWPLLDERKRYNRQMKRIYSQFEDFDCSSQGFEGVRAQDILGELLRHFNPRRFFATGGVIDPFIDRGFGFGFDVTRDDDQRLLEFIADLNDALLDAGQIKPTLMLAHFVNESCEERHFRTRTARACVRDPGNTPQWTTNYPPVPVFQ